MTAMIDGATVVRSRRVLAAVLSAVLATATPLRAQGAEKMPIPPDVQVPLLLKILTYDRSFGFKAKTAVSIGVVFVPTDPGSVAAKDEIMKSLAALSGRTIKNLPLKAVMIPFTNAREFPADLKKAWQANGVNVFYIAPGSSAIVGEVIKLSHAQGVTTATGVPEYVNQGVAIGIDRDQNKPQIVINLPNSKSEGSEFDASLLRIARLVK